MYKYKLKFKYTIFICIKVIKWGENVLNCHIQKTKGNKMLKYLF